MTDPVHLADFRPLAIAVEVKPRWQSRGFRCEFLKRANQRMRRLEAADAFPFSLREKVPRRGG